MKTNMTGPAAGWAMRIAGAILLLTLAPWAQAREPKQVSCRVELDRSVLPVGSEQTAVIRVVLDPPKSSGRGERPPVNLSIVLDRSGSMSGEKLDKAKEAAIEALRRLGASDMFSLVIYDHEVETIVPAQSAANTEWIEGRIRQIQSGGNTALFGGVSQGAAEIRKNIEGHYVNRIILLSDGMANVGPSSPGDLGRLGSGLMKEDISVTTIGVGTDYNEDLMARLANDSDGNTYFVRESRDLARIFNEELGDVLSIVARRVNIIIECPDGVRPLRVIGREGRIHGRTVELSLNQLYSGQEKFVLLEVGLPNARDGERREIATARVDYENPVTRKMESASGNASAEFSSDANKVDRSENKEVVRTHELNVNAMTVSEAISLADQKKPGEAAAVLRQAAFKMQSVGSRLDDSTLKARASEMRKKAEKIEAEGQMDGDVRKEMRADEYQTYNQQRAK